MSISWQKTTLGEACRQDGGNIQTGPFGSQLHQSDYVKDGVPFLMPVNIGENRVIIDNVKMITEHDRDRLSRYELRTGDILYSRRGDVERRALIREAEDGWVCGSGCLRVRFQNGGINPEFASYQLGAPSTREWIVRHAVGATMANLNTQILSDVPFVIPPIDIQKRIANILGSLDDKIELNRQMNKTLEEMAQAIFKSWFVDFEPVKAKTAAKAAGLSSDAIQRAAMAAIAGKAASALDHLPTETLQSLAHKASLFPDAFEDSELGEIPKGWRVSTIGEETETVGGATPSTSNPAYWLNGDNHWVTPKDFSQLQDNILVSSSRKITDAGLSKISSGLLPVNTVLMSSRAPVGYIAISKIETAINQGFIAMKCTKQLTPEYVLQWANHSMTDIKQAASGSTFAEISKKTFRPFPILIPSNDALKLFSDIAAPFYEKIAENVIEAMTLADLRDTLLPKLLSGELSIADTEKLAEQAAV